MTAAIPKIVLQLGDVVFADAEIPAKITFGGRQALSVHELVGGVRVADAMGRQDAPLEWAGYLQGQSAVTRAKALDALRVSGTPIMLTWSEFRFWVVVETFLADFEYVSLLPYRIACTVLIDYSGQTLNGAQDSVDTLVQNDMATANTLSNQVNDGQLTGLMGTLNSAITNVSSFATATQSTINGVLQPIAAVQARVAILQASVGNTIQNVTTLGGILPGNPISTQAARLTTQLSAMQQSTSLVNLQYALGRVSTNLTTINSGTSSVTTAGGNLMTIAAAKYGDPTAWTGLARANNLTDPKLSGITTVAVPANPDLSGGVLNG